MIPAAIGGFDVPAVPGKVANLIREPDDSGGDFKIARHGVMPHHRGTIPPEQHRHDGCSKQNGEPNYTAPGEHIMLGRILSADDYRIVGVRCCQRLI